MLKPLHLLLGCSRNGLFALQTGTIRKKLCTDAGNKYKTIILLKLFEQLDLHFKNPLEFLSFSFIDIKFLVTICGFSYDELFHL